LTFIFREKKVLHKNIERIHYELQQVHDKCEEMRSAKQEAVRELLTLQEQHRAELRITTNCLQEEMAARETLERRLCELRTEVIYILERTSIQNVKNKFLTFAVGTPAG
jgi:coiled-coil domain-containing protein 102